MLCEIKKKKMDKPAEVIYSFKTDPKDLQSVTSLHACKNQDQRPVVKVGK